MWSGAPQESNNLGCPIPLRSPLLAEQRVGERVTDLCPLGHAVSVTRRLIFTNGLD
jgi:hypothetical protein